MSTANFEYAKNFVYEKLTLREQRKLFNSLEHRLGFSRARTRDIFTDDDDGDYKTSVVEKQQELQSYQHKIQLIMQIINKNEKDAKIFDLHSRPKELRLLVDRLTYGQIGRLNFNGLCRMLRVATQAKDATNPTAYILSSYKNLVEGKDFKKKWAREREVEEDQQFAESLAQAEQRYREDRELASKVNLLGGVK
ncbi:MAG: hypothetical protein IKT33_03570 [Clostridia bacterium]|nr:hypothetical protein [Clostridia bacterium]